MQALIELIDCDLKQYSFKRLDETLHPKGLSNEVIVRALWKRKTWNTNRGVALLEVNQGLTSIEQFTARILGPVGKTIGYFPFFYPLGLQLILAGHGINQEQERLRRALDKIDTQTIMLQSIYLVDLNNRVSSSARTWGQYITGRFQDAIERAIKSFLEA